MSECTVTLFGRSLADMPPADANVVRRFVADLDDCPDCAAVVEHRRLFTEYAQVARWTS